MSDHALVDTNAKIDKPTRSPRWLIMLVVIVLADRVIRQRIFGGPYGHAIALTLGVAGPTATFHHDPLWPSGLLAFACAKMPQHEP
jgi:hypothetical protein